jgi:hypothetical protein
MILTALMTMALLLFIAPNIFALNRGHILRNVALWLAIFLGLAAVYQTFGPDSPHPLFQLPEAMTGMRSLPLENKQPAGVSNKPGAGKENDTKNTDSIDNGEQGFTPPKE